MKREKDFSDYVLYGLGISVISSLGFWAWPEFKQRPGPCAENPLVAFGSIDRPEGSMGFSQSCKFVDMFCDQVGEFSAKNENEIVIRFASSGRKRILDIPKNAQCLKPDANSKEVTCEYKIGHDEKLGSMVIRCGSGPWMEFQNLSKLRSSRTSPGPH